MKTLTLILLMLTPTFASLFGQQPDYQALKTAKLEEMKKLDFMKGEWKGTGWISMGQTQREDFTLSETITTRVDGLVLVVEGLGKDLSGNRVVHNALGIISWDNDGRHYAFDTFLADGRATRATAELIGKKLVWGFEVPQGQIRYTLDFSFPGRWIEQGDFSPDGNEWYKFMEMTMSRIKE